MIFNETDEVLAHVDVVGATAQKDMVAALAGVQLEEQFCLAGMLTYNLVEFFHHPRVEIVGSDRDGEAVAGSLLHALKILDVLHLEGV